MSRAANPSREAIAERILALAAARGPQKTICPSEAARSLAGDHPDAWSPLMPAVRRAAVALMKAGRVVIKRKGRPVDPDDFRGIYRIAIAADGPGEADAVRAPAGDPRSDP